MTTTCSMSIRRGASTSNDPVTAVRELAAALEQPDTRFVLFHCAPEYDLDALSVVPRYPLVDPPVTPSADR